jgi:hypothetical protein
MTTLQDHRKRLSNAWRADQQDDDPHKMHAPNYVLRSGDRIRVPMNMMDSRSVVDQTAGRQFYRSGNTVLPICTDAERARSAELVLAQRQRVSSAWKYSSGHADTKDAEEAAIASIPGNALAVKSAPALTGDAIEDARNAMHHRLETAYLNGGIQ